MTALDFLEPLLSQALPFQAAVHHLPPFVVVLLQFRLDLSEYAQHFVFMCHRCLKMRVIYRALNATARIQVRANQAARQAVFSSARQGPGKSRPSSVTVRFRSLTGRLRIVLA